MFFHPILFGTTNFRNIKVLAEDTKILKLTERMASMDFLKGFLFNIIPDADFQLWSMHFKLCWGSFCGSTKDIRADVTPLFSE